MSTATGSPARAPMVIWQASAVALLVDTADNVLLLLVLWIAGPQGWSGIRTALVVLTLRLPALFFGGLAGRAVDLWGARLVVRLDLCVRTVSLLFLLDAGLITGSLPL